MALTRWDPFGEMAVLREQMDRLMGGHGRREGLWMPAIDVVDSPDELRIMAEVPGMNAEDVSISCDEDSLTLSGERRFEEHVEEGRWASVERHFGRFERSIPLPRTAKRDEIGASYSNGILEVRVPKAEVAQPRRIEIRQSGGHQIRGAMEQEATTRARGAKEQQDMSEQDRMKGRKPETEREDTALEHPVGDMKPSDTERAKHETEGERGDTALEHPVGREGESESKRRSTGGMQGSERGDTALEHPVGDIDPSATERGRPETEGERGDTALEHPVGREGESEKKRGKGRAA
jgi:HSP20 family protein